MTTKPLSWIVTGASSGLGQSIAIAALQAGHKVVGTTRNVSQAEKTNPTFSEIGGIWAQLDPAQKDSYDQFSKLAKEHDVDVLVNCAGYAFVGGVEDISEEELRSQMEVNFFGPFRAIQACLPVMRTKAFGHVVLISSGAGFIARPGRCAYSASKFAIEAVHEALVQEVKGLGIKVLIVEPGAFRTRFSTRILTPAAYESTGGISEPYKGSELDKMLSLSKGITEIPIHLLRGSPDKAGREIIKAVETGYDYLRMILGPDCVAAMELKIGSLQHDLEATRVVAMSTDLDEK
ncbi:hypothetical protein GGR51DRAFT_576754 [Nemania sp. FL0031]|nr:hypothetical protein GGR51DRAFT_576754 [Nemania sp. FL0031]